MTEPEVEYYYVSYNCVGLLSGAGIVKQKKVPEFASGDFNLAGATSYIYKLLEVPVIITHWTLITKKRAEDYGRFVDNVMKDVPGAKTKDNIAHLRLVPTDAGKAETAAPPIEPGPYAKN